MLYGIVQKLVGLLLLVVRSCQVQVIQVKVDHKMSSCIVYKGPAKRYDGEGGW